MALTSGTKLGPYVIESPLGAGGMGEVYRARDSRLDRTVAIKILPSRLSDSQEAQQRFDREARAISSLSHPNICHLYDVGAQDGTSFLVMEFLDGQTLADRLLKGPLPIDQTLKYGIDICEGLEKAHRNGVVHRDLKPGNIMLTKSGAKLMDFGLAKPLLAATRPSSDLTQSLVTPRQPLTTEGTLVGTFQYMSPEQVEGKEADARSDIFSFGAVLYEMVTGKPAFEGKTMASTIAAILAAAPPPMAGLQPLSSPALEATVKSCLAKDPDERLQSAHDVKLQLKWLSIASGNATPDEKQPGGIKRWLVPGLAVLCLALAASLVSRMWQSPAKVESPVTRFTVTLPHNQELATDATQAVALSADGIRLAYVAAESGISRLYIHRLDQFPSIEIPDSEGATFPFFSPNGEWVAFFSQGKLKKAPADGGQPAVVCDIQTFFGGTWLPNDTIIVAVPNFGLASVPASGGSLQKVAINAKENFYPQGPAWLPDGEWLMFRDYFSEKRTLVVNLRTGELRQLGKNVEAVAYTAGYLIYYNNGALWSAPFDLGKVAITGNPVELERGVTERNYVGQGTASDNGVLAYAPGAIGNFSRNIYAVSRNGQEQKLNVPAQDYVDPSVSPDGKRLAIVVRRINEQQVAIYDRDRDVMTIVVPNGAINASPVWAPDGKVLLFDSNRSSQQRGIYQVAADGGSAPLLIRETTVNSHVTAIAGNYAALMVNDPTTSNDLWLMSFDAQHSIQPFKRTSAAERQGTLSPDGRWMAYVSNESGRSEIYVEPVPGPGGRWQISNDGGEQPRWVGNGKEIVYRNGNKVMSVPVSIQPVFQAGRSVELFEGKFDRGGAVGGYDVTPDGKTFFMTRSEQANPTEIRVVTGLRFDKRTAK